MDEVERTLEEKTRKYEGGQQNRKEDKKPCERETREREGERARHGGEERRGESAGREGAGERKGVWNGNTPRKLHHLREAPADLLKLFDPWKGV